MASPIKIDTNKKMYKIYEHFMHLQILTLRLSLRIFARNIETFN